MYTYYLKALLVATIALFFSVVAFNNIVDYNTNWMFVKHVLSMDTIPQPSPLMGRAIHHHFLQQTLYIIIICWEAITAVICWMGAYSLLNKKIKIANIGLMTGLMLYLLGFCIIASEWFAAWQSAQSGVQVTAYLFSTIILLILIFINQPHKDS